MARTDYVPPSDAALESWAVNFSSLITATPVPYGLVAGDATALANLVTAYSEALQIANEPGTRTPVAVAIKDTARAVLIAELRSLARRIRANPAVTVAQKTGLGLNVADRVFSPTPPPATRPVLALVAIRSLSQIIRLQDETTPTSRARPEGAVGAQVYTYVGENPPADLRLWRHEGLATRSEFLVRFQQADIGKAAQVRAVWINRTGEPGPASDPVGGTVAG